MVIFHSYLSLPEGNPAKSPRKFWIPPGYTDKKITRGSTPRRGLEDLEVEAQKRGDLAVVSAPGLCCERQPAFGNRNGDISPDGQDMPG